MLDWLKLILKKWLGVDALESENAELKTIVSVYKQYTANTMKELQSYITVDADIGIRGNNTVVLTGIIGVNLLCSFTTYAMEILPQW